MTWTNTMASFGKAISASERSLWYLMSKDILATMIILSARSYKSCVAWMHSPPKVMTIQFLSGKRKTRKRRLASTASV